MNEFWWGLNGKERPSDRRPSPFDDVPRLMDVLAGYRDATPPQSWSDAVATFDRAMADAVAARDLRMAAYRLGPDLVEARTVEAGAHERVVSAEARVDEVGEARARALAATEAASASIEEQRTRRLTHQRLSPAFFQNLISLGRVRRDWRLEADAIAGALAAAEQAGRARGAEADLAERAWRRAGDELAEHRRALEVARSVVEELERQERAAARSARPVHARR